MRHGAFDPSSRSPLTARDLPRFGGGSLFDGLGRALCAAGCLPRKELFESWEVARRVRRRFRGGRVVDLACGHGLIAHLMLLLDDSSPEALAVDVRLPRSSAAVAAALVQAWPRLHGRVTLRQGNLEAVDLRGGDVVVSAHACGALTDTVLARATAARARVAVLPCCHDTATCDDGGLRPWMDAALAIDATRALRVQAAGYAVHAQQIPPAITPKGRLLLAAPAAAAGPASP